MASIEDMTQLFVNIFGARFGNVENGEQRQPANFAETMRHLMGNQVAAINEARDAINELVQKEKRTSSKIIDIPLFYGKDDEDPAEWLQLFNQAVKANGWDVPDERKIA